MHLKQNDKDRIVARCQNEGYDSFGEFKVQRVDDMDGFKYFLNDDEWFMIRPSGTEPVLRTYAEAATKEKALAILKAGYDTLLN